MPKRGAARNTRSGKGWLARRSEPERAALISATAVLVAAALTVTGTVITNTLLTRHSDTPVAPGAGPSFEEPARVDAVKSAIRGREVVINDHDSVDLDSPRRDFAVTSNDSAPGVDLTVRLGYPALDLATDAYAVKAGDGADLAFCRGETSHLENIDSKQMAPGKAFCVQTGRGAWLWLKIIRSETNEEPSTITLLIDRLA